MNILHIDCSPRLESHSRRLSAAIVEELLKVSPAADITRRDLGAAPLPHAAADYATTLSSPVTLSAPLEGALDLAEALIQEVEAADVIIIGTPMHNLTIPSVLKAWIDQILRVGRTMMSTPAGKVGMLDDRPVFIGIASGGTFTGARANQPDFLTPYLSEVLGSIGLKSLQFLSVQATAFLEGEAAAGAREKVLAAIDLSLVDPIASKVPERLCDRGEEIVAVSRKDGVDTVTGEALANASVVTDVSHFPSSEAAADLGLLKPEERVQRPASRMRRADTEQHCNGKVSSMEQSPKIGDRITGLSAAPDASTIRDWIGPKAFEHWRELEGWIDENYPGVFTPEWLDGGKKRGWSLRYKKTRAFCTFLPEYGRFSVVVVFGSAERDKFEERRYAWRSQLAELYDEARSYPDGKFLTLPVSTADDRQEVMDLLIMKRPPPSRP